MRDLSEPQKLALLAIAVFVIVLSAFRLVG
jgi:hypothetical protein